MSGGNVHRRKSPSEELSVGGKVRRRNCPSEEKSGSPDELLFKKRKNRKETRRVLFLIVTRSSTSRFIIIGLRRLMKGFVESRVKCLKKCIWRPQFNRWHDKSLIQVTIVLH